MRSQLKALLGAALICAALPWAEVPAANRPVQLLNVSYDVSRELFAQINPIFAQQWKAKTGQTVEVRQSHGGSSKQARSVAEGLQADVVTFNQVTDIEFLHKSGLVGADWQNRFPHHASPYYSLPIILVRKGNPKRIKDWDDLARADVKVIFANPKTSGNGRYAYLGAYTFALEKYQHDESKARAFVGRVLANVPVLDTGGRGATTTFVEHEIGDALVTFESEVSTLRQEYSKSALEVIMPSVSVRADFPVAVVDTVAARHGTGEIAHAYLEFLYSETGQELLAKNYNRVYSHVVADRYKAQFPEVRLLSIETAVGSWDEIMKTHFADGGVFDQVTGAEKH